MSPPYFTFSFLCNPYSVRKALVIFRQSRVTYLRTITNLYCKQLERLLYENSGNRWSGFYWLACC